ncbi:3' terminal RNA ribose 2'-O-methyltransferase Hen1 [Tengunoibacter tsumagoiensis]|uniref:Small RNA 2'-O-methyltransferase n=1 Tax=Tengunoibacter tsumagoiensis TaxID=2014871 RepID=A0A402A2Y0_9CHLR|nr:3' terminal RNA ribose 2'-O-methyltransferase Hen1 [Tengunoibacter tsumagoiensis]GCE13500.1 3' terminal RNA ribose 2'-O-methyltransferase Hen1 [Tengunoibacter tsumagoiensis]
MLLTISTTHQPATDLGYLLHKNPAHLQTFNLKFGQAHVFYPEATNERCTAALLLEIDTIELVRNKGLAFDQYVNDRPYVASSFMSVALAEVFRSAINGRCVPRPELVQTAIPLQACLAMILCHGGEDWLRRLFEPLGYTVEIIQHELDELHPTWGLSPYFTVTINANCKLSDLLTHLYVLIPVLDNRKHYWIGDDEVDKLLQRGQGWLEKHPERKKITYNYLKQRADLTRDALTRLIAEEENVTEVVEISGDEAIATDEASNDQTNQTTEETVKQHEEETPAIKEKRTSLHEQRLLAAVEVLKQSGAKRVLDLGCGEGRLIKKLLKEKNFEQILGLDVSYKALELAKRRLHLDRLPSRQRERLTLLHGSLTYRDRRIEGYDAAAVVEVIEHLDQSRLSAFERVLFEFAHPATIVITTPNAEYNVKYETLAAGKFRHHDHRFEWTRTQFQQWSQQLAERFGYTVTIAPVGPEDEKVGAPSQMGIFVLTSDQGNEHG